MNEEEKRGFRNGCRYIIDMMYRTKIKLENMGETSLSRVFMAIIEEMEKEIDTATDFYAVIGERMFENRSKKDG